MTTKKSPCRSELKLGRCEQCAEPGTTRLGLCVVCREPGEREIALEAMKFAAEEDAELCEREPHRAWRHGAWLPRPRARYGNRGRREDIVKAFWPAVNSSRWGSPLEWVKAWETQCDMIRRRHREERMAGMNGPLELPPYPLVRRDEFVVVVELASRDRRAWSNR